jgi:signal transduction histidine kinase
MPAQQRLISLADFVAEVEISAALEAGAHGCKFSVSDVAEGLAVDGDRDMLLAAVGNLLQNAFKFTQAHTQVSLNVHSAADRILIEVEDRCGGLPPGVAEDLFQPFTQSGEDKSGLGLGLAISRRSVEANHGVLRVRDLPGVGCVFTVDLPRWTVSS